MARNACKDTVTLTGATEDAALRGVPVGTNGEPEFPPLSDADLQRQIEIAEASLAAAPEQFEPAQADWSEADDAFVFTSPVAA